jgi:hypothetical protein
MKPLCKAPFLPAHEVSGFSEMLIRVLSQQATSVG